MSASVCVCVCVCVCVFVCEGYLNNNSAQCLTKSTEQDTK